MTATSQARLVILKTGDTLPPIKEAYGDFDRWFLNGLSDQLERYLIDVTREPLQSTPEQWDGIVVTGSPAMVSDRAPWSESAAAWLTEGFSPDELLSRVTTPPRPARCYSVSATSL